MFNIFFHALGKKKEYLLSHVIIISNDFILNQVYGLYILKKKKRIYIYIYMDYIWQ